MDCSGTTLLDAEDETFRLFSDELLLERSKSISQVSPKEGAEDDDGNDDADVLLGKRP